MDNIADIAATGGVEKGLWWKWDDEKGDMKFHVKDVTFNGKTSVTFAPYDDTERQKKGPTKTLNRLNHKKTDITLPNGVKTWFVLWTDDHMVPHPTVRDGRQEFIKTPEQAREKALREPYNVLRGQTPRDERYVRVRLVKVKDVTELHVEQVFVWGGCVYFIEKTLEVVKNIPRKTDDLSKFSVYVGAWVWARNTLCEEITKAVFHPDRVERMEAVYGEEWDDSFHTHTGVGTADPKAWEKREAQRKQRVEEERARRMEAEWWRWD